MLESALFYRRDCGFSVVPIRFEDEGGGKVRKKPLVAWKKYQEQYPTPNEIREWFAKWPDAGIAVITGKLSRICSLDLDAYKPNFNMEKVKEVFGELPPGPTFKTPRGGWQRLYLLPEGGIGSFTDLLPGLDLKGEGGMATLPPSKNGMGQYTWVAGMSLNEIELGPVPASLLKNIIIYIGKKGKGKTQESQRVTSVTGRHNIFTEGRRDEDLFHAANCLLKGGAELSFIQKALELLAFGCTPPFDLREIPAKIESALRRSERRERNVASEVREWVNVTTGHWNVTDCHRESQIVTKEEKHACRQELYRLRQEGIIEPVGQKYGEYRRVEKDIEFLDFTASTPEEFGVALPLGLSNHAVIQPKNIIVFAGSKDAGKTAIALDLVKMNIGRIPIVYMTSEMGQVELKKRLQAHKDMTLDMWRAGMTAVYRGHNWQDLITDERKIFVVDYVEPPEEALYQVGTILRAIHEKLKEGIAVCFIQKKYNELLGRGGQFTLDKARLYVGLDPGRPNKATIVSCKSFRNENPRGMTMHYKIFAGWKIESQGYWKHEAKKEE